MMSDEEVVSLFRKEAGRVRGYLLNCGASPDTADECVNDGFLAVARHPGPLKNPLAYAYTVARNQMIHAWKRCGREVPTDRQEDVPDTDSDPSDRLIQQEEEAAVRRALARLRAGRAKEAIVLRFMAGFSLTEAAAIMGVSAGAAKRYTHEGLKAVRIILEDEDREGEGR